MHCDPSTLYFLFLQQKKKTVLLSVSNKLAKLYNKRHMDDHISDQGHLTCDLTWPPTATRGIILCFPRCNSFHFSIFFALIESNDISHFLPNVEKIFFSQNTIVQLCHRRNILFHPATGRNHKILLTPIRPVKTAMSAICAAIIPICSQTQNTH